MPLSVIICLWPRESESPLKVKKIIKMSCIDDLPEEILLIIFKLVPYEKETLSQVSVRWKQIVEDNFRFPLLDFFRSVRSHKENDNILCSRKRYTKIWLKIFPNNVEQFNTLKSLQIMNPTSSFDIIFAPARFVTPKTGANCLDSYLKVLQNVEKLTLKFCFRDEKTIKFLKSPILMRNLTKLEIQNGQFLRVYENLRAPKVEELRFTSTYERFDMVKPALEFIKKNIRSSSALKYVTIGESVSWYRSHLEINKSNPQLPELFRCLSHLLKDVRELEVKMAEDRKLINFLARNLPNLETLDVKHTILQELDDVVLKSVKKLWIADFSCSVENIMELQQKFPNATHLNFFEAQCASEQQKDLIWGTFKYLKKLYFLL
jgi:hypothetical protein